jgi:hypothetical protein
LDFDFNIHFLFYFILHSAERFILFGLGGPALEPNTARALFPGLFLGSKYLYLVEADIFLQIALVHVFVVPVVVQYAPDQFVEVAVEIGANNFPDEPFSSEFSFNFFANKQVRIFSPRRRKSFRGRWLKYRNRFDEAPPFALVLREIPPGALVNALSAKAVPPLPLVRFRLAPAPFGSSERGVHENFRGPGVVHALYVACVPENFPVEVEGKGLHARERKRFLRCNSVAPLGVS